MSLQDRVITYRAKYGFTQSQMAQKCGVSTITIQKIEKGSDRIRPVIRAKVDIVLGAENESK